MLMIFFFFFFGGGGGVYSIFCCDIPQGFPVYAFEGLLKIDKVDLLEGLPF